MPTALLALPEVAARLAEAAEPWRSTYADSSVLPVVLNAAHVGALLVAGGLALGADRQTWRAARGGTLERTRQLTELAGVHAIVLGALVFVVASGGALFLADVEEFAGSPWYWGKMALLAALLANGWLMRRAERAVALQAEPAPMERGWRALRVHAATSASLWLAVTVAGVVLRES